MSFVTYSQLGSNGQLGNQLFQIASTIGMAAKNDLFYAFRDWKYQEYFTNPLPNNKDFIETHKKPFKNVPEKSFTFEDTLLDGQFNYNILGYRQSPLYWEPHAQELIKKYFEFDKKVLDKVQEKWYNILANKPVAVHFRLKDYIQFSEFHTNLHLTDYYKDAIKLFEGQNLTDEPIKYVIFSDDLEWCKNNLFQYLGGIIHSDNILYSEDFNEIEDLVLGSLCGHNIIANSTFSWFQAYLNKNESKMILSPGGLKYGWFGPKATHDTKDLIPKDWCKL